MNEIFVDIDGFGEGEEFTATEWMIIVSILVKKFEGERVIITTKDIDEMEGEALDVEVVNELGDLRLTVSKHNQSNMLN